MVSVEELPPSPPQETRSESRLADATELESLLVHVQRDSLKRQLTQLHIKLQKDAKALQLMEKSQAKAASTASEQEGSAESPQDVEASTSPAALRASTAVPTAKPAAPVVSTKKYISIDKFSFDAGSYGSKNVSVYISLPGVGSMDPANITCPFTKSSFDLSVHDLKGKNYRLIKDNLDKEIDVEKSKIIIKADRIVIKLAKVKSEYGSYDSWTDLTSKKGKSDTKKSKAKDPSASIMDLMKDMYDSGDDNMKKMIGETMMKQREGKMGNGMDDLDYKPGAI